MAKDDDDDSDDGLNHPCVIIAGTLFDGLRVVGPFPNYAAASAFDSEHRSEDTQPSWIFPMIQPSSGPSMDDLWMGQGEHFYRGDEE